MSYYLAFSLFYMKIKKKMWEEEEDDEKQLVVGDAPLDTIDLHNLAVPILKK